MRKIAVIIAVEPAPLRRIVELLLPPSEFRIVKNIGAWPALAREAFLLRPELVITNVKLLGNGAAKIVSNLKLASPDSKLIVISFPHDLERCARKWGADAYLEEEQLVQRLVPTAYELCGPVRPRIRKTRGAGRLAKTRRMSTHRSSSNSGKNSQFRVRRNTSSDTHRSLRLRNHAVESRG